MAAANNNLVPEVISASRYERQLLLTFGRGETVPTEAQVREYFVTTYGAEALEGVYMEEAPFPSLPPLFARVFFRSASSIPAILNDAERVTMVINGINVTARRFVPPQRSTQPPPPAPPAARPAADAP